MGTLEILEDAEAVAARAADVLAGLLDGLPTATVCLAGGSTPERLYRLLAQPPYRERIAWERLEFFWGDERFVPLEHPDSNAGMARRALLDHVPARAERVHPIPTAAPDAETAARDYETLLRGRFPGPGPRFDVLLLGLGADGHVASLFPGSPALEEASRWVVSTRPGLAPLVERVTLTLPALNAARNVVFLAAGAGKRRAVTQALSGRPPLMPGAQVRPADGQTLWLVDKEAAPER